MPGCAASVNSAEFSFELIEVMRPELTVAPELQPESTAGRSRTIGSAQLFPAETNLSSVLKYAG